MSKQDKDRAQLVTELEALRRRVAALEAAEIERVQAEEALRQSERELQLTLEATTDGIWTWNFQTGELTFSSRYYTMLGYEPGAFPASYESWVDLIHPDDREPALAAAESWLATKSGTYENRFRLRTQDGDYRWMLARGRVVERDETGAALRMIGNHEDITERVQVERALRESEVQWRSLTETSPDHILTLDTDLNIQHANFASSGLTVEQLIGTSLYTYVEKERQAEIKAILEGVLRTGKDASYETTYHTPEGSAVYYESRVTPRRLPGSETIIGLTLSARDATERVQAKQALAESEERLQLALEATNDGLWDLDLRTGEAYFSPRYFTMLGYEPGEFPPSMEAWLDLIHPDDRPRVQEVIADHIGAIAPATEAGSESFRVQFRLRTKEGGWRWVLDRGRVVSWAGDIPTRMVGVHVDITEQVQAAQTLRESEERYRLHFETVSDIIYSLDSEFRLVDISPSVEKIMGYR
ncbi:MAG: PAS domain-containing protein, partial [Armatimonadetes bacterium]|nr:PAS domain-containing protein [Armatimonadota bacterium]